MFLRLRKEFKEADEIYAVSKFTEYGKQNYLIVDESGLNFKKLNVFEERQENYLLQ